MRRFLTPHEIGEALNGRWLRPPGCGRGDDVALRGVGTDTREDLTACAFFALRGAAHDGHDHLGAAVVSGAHLLVVDREVDCTSIPLTTPLLLVDDTRFALGDLARRWRRRLTGTVIGITGSVGKTTTKHLLDAILTGARRGVCARKSFNNEVGVPLTLLAGSPDDEYVICEIGTNAPGEIGRLGSIVQPDIAIITAIARSHLEGLGSIEGVVHEKAALLGHIRPGGIAFVPDGIPEFSDCVAPDVEVVRHGEGPDAALRLTGYSSSPGVVRFEVNGIGSFEQSLPGRHNAVNAMLAVAAAHRLGVEDDHIRSALRDCEGPPMRMQRERLGDVEFFNDAYNANPESMSAGIRTFLDLTRDARRRVLILGDMLELGIDASSMHREIGVQLAMLSRVFAIDRLIFIGRHGSDVYSGVAGSMPAKHVRLWNEADDKAMARIIAALQPGDAVFLKASRAVRLERVLDAYRDRLKSKQTTERTIP